MPVQPTYPGVYIQEVSSGVRAIAGVSTSVCAFVGRTQRGPVNEPVSCFNFGDFQRRFGGLDVNRPLGYAVDDFYRNGGSHSIIVRLFKSDPDQVQPSGKAQLTVGGLQLEAAFPGEWGNGLQAWVSHPTDITAAAAYAERYPGIEASQLFDLMVTDSLTGSTENYQNVAIHSTAGPRRLDRVLAEASNLIRVKQTATSEPELMEALPTVTPDEGVSAIDGNDGLALDATDISGSEQHKTGIYALNKADLFNLLCIPPDTREADIPSSVWSSAAAFCAKKRALLIIDPPASWDSNPDTAAATVKQQQTNSPLISLANARNAALFFPRIVKSDLLLDGQQQTFAPCGAVAGVMARTDVKRGVWKAPAGIEATLAGVSQLSVKLTDQENGQLNPIGVNCLRSFPVVGRVVWGSRTLRGADQLADDYKYIPVRRLALFIEETLYRGTQWVVFEPNDEPLWAQIRLNIGAFMQQLFRQGAFQGASAKEAYFVKCDSETTTQADINLGVVNIVIGFAPLQPAEFVVINIQQIRSAQ